MSNQFQILAADGIANEGIELLRKDFAVEVRDKISHEELLEIIPKFDALIVRSASKVTADVLERAANLKIIGRAGVGVDNIDVPEATARGIIVINSPGGNTTAATEHTMGMMLAMARHIAIANETTQKGEWNRKKYTGVELMGKTLGIVGCGNIGSRVAVRALALEMNVMCYDPYKPACDFPDGVEVVRDLDRIFKESDYVSLHAPNTPVTHDMVNKERLAMMKPTAFLINTARGGLVVEEDLYEACRDGVIAGAGLDAIRQEPVDPKNPLLTLDNVIIYPHIGGNTAEAAHRASYFAAMGVQEVYEGKTPTWPINDVDYATAKTYDDVKKPDRKPAGMFEY